jgi:hypothetical protein
MLAELEKRLFESERERVIVKRERDQLDREVKNLET